MSAEFTGERVIPGQVDVDLWNEHLSRYGFAARLARRKRVLDVGCGAGYGSAELANTAVAVTGIDIGPEAIAYANENYARPNLTFQQGSAAQLPFPDASFDLVVAFEVIEHLTDWANLIAEARRVLAPGGQFVVSTPNKSYYAETRRDSGPNPFHEHEFEYNEFQEALQQYFPHTLLFTQNHTDSIVFRPVSDAHAPADVRLDGKTGAVEEAHFYIAVCAAEAMTGAPAFLYVPSAANVLRERERHIQRLESELATKDAWLRESQEKLAELVSVHGEQTAELKRSNDWAMELNQKLESAGTRIVELQEEVVAGQAAAQEAVSGYAAELARVEAQRVADIAAWQAHDEARQKELADCAALLDKAEATVIERTHWAQGLESEAENLRAQLAAVQVSRWMRLGRSIGLGPKVG